MKKTFIATLAVFAFAQAAPAIAYTSGNPVTFDAAHEKCKKGEVKDAATGKCVKQSG